MVDIKYSSHALFRPSFLSIEPPLPLSCDTILLLSNLDECLDIISSFYIPYVFCTVRLLNNELELRRVNGENGKRIKMLMEWVPRDGLKEGGGRGRRKGEGGSNVRIIIPVQAVNPCIPA